MTEDIRELIGNQLRLLPDEIDIIEEAGLEFKTEFHTSIGTTQLYRMNQISVSIVAPNAVRNPSMTNTYHGHSDVDITDKIVSLVTQFRDKKKEE